MSSYAYIESFFKAVLAQSKTIQGRFYIVPRGGSELNTDEFEHVIKLVDGKNKFPACVMMPPRSSGNYGGSEEWETYRFVLFFLNTTYYTNNQVNRPNPLTQTSSHTVIEDWDEMKVAATDFLRVVGMVQKGKNSTSSNLINTVFRMGSGQRYLDPVSFAGSARLSGVKLEFEASLWLGCVIQDYIDGGLVVLPEPDTGSFETDLLVVRNEVLNIITSLGLASEGAALPRSYEHTQSIPSNQWVINHNLGFKPAGIIVQDTQNETYYPNSVSWPSINQIIINFNNSTFAGKAWLS